MGRSVSYPSNAIVAFKHYDQTEDCEDCNGTGRADPEIEDGSKCQACDGDGYAYIETDWDEEIDYYRDWIKEVFPSFSDCDTWVGREDHAIAENKFCYFGISEYCGLVSLWLVKPDNLLPEIEPLADKWMAQVEAKFLKTFGTLRKLGSMSNGEGVYQAV